MDKNFISIDDLVRQRLGGEEEKERSGAWLQMRDLLDKEMPQDRGGFLYWRRTFGAVALILLATSASVGGYLYATRSLNATNNSSVATNYPANNNVSVNNTTTDSKAAITADNTSANNITTDNATAKHRVAHTDAANVKSHSTEANSSETNHPIANNTTIGTASKTTRNIDVNDTKQLSAGPDADSKKAAEGQADKQADQPSTENIAVSTPIAHIGKQALASGHKATSDHKSSSKTDADRRKKFLAGVVASNNRHKKAVAEINKKEIGKKFMASNTKAAAKSHPPLADGTNSATAHHSGHKSGATKTSEVASVDAKTAPVNQGGGAVSKKEQTVNTSKLALGSNVTGTKNIPNGSAKPADTHDKPLAENSKPGNSKTVAPRPVSGNEPGNGPGKNKTTGASHSSTATGPGTATPSEEVAAKREQVPFDRVTITEHYVSTNRKVGYYKYDTISIEQLARELGINNSNDPSHTEETRKEENTSGTNSNNSLASGNTPILPESSASATGKNGLGTKQSQAGKGGSGESTLDKLNATFNDVKYHVSGMQFAAGLTGGINATFFGPNSFKGFQFGVTGNFIFGDNVSAMAEVKYFHRINNDYSLNDNYYSYTQVGPGQWSKQQLSSSYSFSTLHSVEMPITIRYMKSHFSFYAGANLVYSFSINTGKSEQPSTLSPILVNAMGNDNTPKVQQSDFNSRFGLGYIAGLSYEVYPNVTLDFRNVQSVWDNASSQGGKYISSQLYKSPSFQVSIGYRLGNNKKKD